MMKNRKFASKIQGMSIVELLIAMLLGISLSAGVVELYINSNSTERSQEARTRMQENGRFGMNFLAQEVRMAGYLGCLGGLDTTTINNTLDAPPASFQPMTGIQGWEANGTDPGEVSNSANDVAVVSSAGGEWTSSAGNVMPTFNAVPNSDIVRVWSIAGTPGIINAITPGATALINAEPIGLNANDVLLLSDCEQADVVQACAVADVGGGASINITISAVCNPGNIATPPITTAVGGQVSKLESTILYVGKRGDQADNPPALFRRRLSATAAGGAAEELIEGVESMQIVYGVNLDNDTRNTVDAYLPADQVPNWQQVITVRINLLMQSIEDQIVPDPQNYSFNGVDYDGGGGNGSLPNDNRVRRVFTNTISLRNRALGV